MPLDLKVAYWAGALVNMVLLVALAWAGVGAVRRGEVPRHRRRMLTAAALVLAFLASYPLKLAWLGREQLELWSRGFVWTLRFHETCVAVMVLAGATAVYQALKLGLPIDAGADRESPELWRGVRRHRRAGWLAVLAATLGVGSAAVVLYGMIARLPA